MSEPVKKAEYINVGSIIENTNRETGEKYQQFVMNKEFITNAKEYLSHAFEDKKGNKRFSMYKPQAGAPDYVIWNISIKKKSL